MADEGVGAAGDQVGAGDRVRGNAEVVEALGQDGPGAEGEAGELGGQQERAGREQRAREGDERECGELEENKEPGFHFQSLTCGLMKSSTPFIASITFFE